MLNHMSPLFRYTAIALGMLVVALMFSVCGEALACAGCGDACCLNANRPEGLPHFLGKVVQACARCGRLVASASLAGASDSSWQGDITRFSSSPLLVSKVAQLRI